MFGAFLNFREWSQSRISLTSDLISVNGQGIVFIFLNHTWNHRWILLRRAVLMNLVQVKRSLIFPQKKEPRFFSFGSVNDSSNKHSTVCVLAHTNERMRHTQVSLFWVAVPKKYLYISQMTSTKIFHLLAVKKINFVQLRKKNIFGKLNS